MPQVKSPPRLTIEITEEQQKTLNRHLHHGMKKKLFGILIDDTCFMLEKFGVRFIAALLLKEVDFKRGYIPDGDDN